MKKFVQCTVFCQLRHTQYDMLLAAEFEHVVNA